jgi:hypothetical protein
MEKWESAAPQRYIHTSGNIRVAEGENVGNEMYNRATYTRI